MLVDRAEAGSMRAALSLKCLGCCAWQRAEVALCQVKGCSLHHLRPPAGRSGRWRGR